MVNLQSAHSLPTPAPDSPIARRRPYHFSTQCATVENPSQKDQYGSSSVPIYQTATFKGMNGEYDYSRSGNPTRSHLEHHLAKISSAQHAFAVSSGMAALDVIIRLLKPGDEVIAGDDLYGGTNRLLAYVKDHGGIIVHHVDTTNPAAVYPYINPEKTAMVLLESPTNPLLKIVDLATIARNVHERAPNAVIVVDNTMMSPYLQRPLEHDADIVYDSGTKYLSGHHDLMAGVITCNRDDLSKRIAFTINASGNALTPFDSFLLLRGIKTLAIRMDRQQLSAIRVAQYLEKLGFKVHYPGLSNHRQRDVHEKLANGAGAVLSFETGDKDLSSRIVGSTRLWGISVSFGAVNSLISMPCIMSHASIDAKTREARGLPEDLIRLCVGIEDPTDLIDDLEHAMVEAGAITLLEDGGYTVNRQGGMKRALQKLESAASKVASDSEAHPWFVSAPGKVILFGEHAVVHGVTAVAASVDLRCYGLVHPRNDGKVSIHLPDIEHFSHTWDVMNLPWDSVTVVRRGHHHGPSLDQKLVEAIISRSLPESLKSEGSRARAATIAFLYLYMTLADDTAKPACDFTARSVQPIGAGLGSSASYSTCLATALLLIHQRITVPPLPVPTRPADLKLGDVSHSHVSHQGRRAIPPTTAEEVNRWAFIGEKVLHGNPSGVDNAAAVFGGAIAFTRDGFGRKPGMVQLQGFKSVKFLLTDSKVGRNTKLLVEGVAKKKHQEPEVVGEILDSIQNISEEAQRALSDPELPRSTLTSALCSLIQENHAHLVALGVSHPALESIRSTTAAPEYGLSTKLTGAGGGGCAVTLVPDNFPESSLKSLTETLVQKGYVPYITSVGGSGLGILAPYLPESDHSPFTPPETPSPDGSSDGSGDELQSLRETFATRSRDVLAEWATQRGKWLYV
ncbi:Cys/Met metabolism PLP-dependent enzyme-domain-containing protein [Hysterangium stoloniferum]|nr:Cys/Met metabolism PLP-dependent enzyme-domain-containing protein [Hysterangium stoloniferum]